MVEKRRFLFFLLILFFTLIYAKLNTAIITGEVITGKATSSSTGVSIQVLGGPSINLIYPENKTYIRTNLSINYTNSGSPTNLYYSIDNVANNTLNSSPTWAIFSEGQERLDLWANNSYGVGNDNIFLTVNTTILVINYSRYNGTFKGSSTDIASIAYEDLVSGVNDLIFENTLYGKIRYRQAINVENDSLNTDRHVNISANIIIANGSVSVNSANLPNFNKSATISLYYLDYSNPRILLDGNVCPSTICANQTYSNGNITFDVLHFTNYSIEETPSSPGEENDTGGSSGGGGGGGGGGAASTYHTIDIITPGTVELGRNDSLVVPITIRNPEQIVMKGIKLYANASTKELSAIFEDILITELLPGQNRTIMLFLKSTNLLPGNYEIELSANVTDPKFTEKEKMYIRAVEIVGKVEVIERILLAQELFRENPECLELTDLLIQAQNLADSGEINNARTLVQEAISRCRDLVTNKEFPNTPDYSKLSNWRTPIEIALILIVITLIIFMIFRRPKIDLRHGGKIRKKKSFFKRMFGR